MPVGDQNVTAPLLPSPHDIALLEKSQTGALGRYRLSDARLDHILSQIRQHEEDSVWRHILAWILNHVGLDKVDVAWLANLLGHIVAVLFVIIAVIGAGLIVYLVIRGAQLLPTTRAWRTAPDNTRPAESDAANSEVHASGLLAVFEHWLNHLQRAQVIRRASSTTNGEILAALGRARPRLAPRFGRIRPALDLRFYALGAVTDEDEARLEATIRSLDQET